MRVAIGIFLILHGLVHAAIYTIPTEPGKAAPFDPRRSWALRVAHVGTYQTERLSVALAGLVAAVYALSGLVALVGVEWWVPVAGAAAILGLAFKVLYFHPWLVFGILLDAAVLTAVASGWFLQVLY